MRINTTETPNTSEHLIARASQLFTNRFGASPRWGAIAPGRVNLIGEHTDYNQGFVLPIAINRHTVIFAGPAHAKSSTLWAADLDQSLDVDLSQPLAPVRASFANYVLGVIQQFHERGHHVPNVNLLIAGNLPRGAGLSSSASLEVAMATLLEQIVPVHLPLVDKALLCQRAEHRFAGVPCGVMDMFTISVAQAGHALLIDCRDYQYQHVPLFLAKNIALLIVDTGVNRSLITGAYATRRATCEAAAMKLGLHSLREASAERLKDDRLTVDEHRKATHVVAENARVLDATTALQAQDLARFGELMFASHDSLRDLFDVSVDELNQIVEAARSRLGTGGVWGARMTGAGFGGCAIVLCHASSAVDVAAAVRSRFAARFGRDPAIFNADAAQGARHLCVPA